MQSRRIVHFQGFVDAGTHFSGGVCAVPAVVAPTTCQVLEAGGAEFSVAARAVVWAIFVHLLVVCVVNSFSLATLPRMEPQALGGGGGQDIASRPELGKLVVMHLLVI